MDRRDSDKAKEDTFVAAMGDTKPWQIIVVLWVCLSKFGTGWHTLAIVFLGAPLEFKCTDATNNKTDKCSIDCVKREYDHSVFEENIISEWELVCENAYLASLSQSIVMFGIMVGSLVFGMISDRFGRRAAFLGCCFMQLLTGPIVAASPWFWFFCIFRFLVAVATGGTMIVSFVIVMELIGPSKRELISITYQLPFNMGHASLAAFGYYLRHWKTYYLTLSLLSLMFLPYICVVPETPRWLFSTGRTDRAIKTLEKAAKFNKMPTESIRGNIEEAYKTKIAATTHVKEGTIVDLFRNPNLRMKTIVMAFEWLVVCLNYYGVSQYMSSLYGDIFVNVALGACLGIPGILLCVPLTKYVGRKYTFILSNFLSSVSLLAIAFQNTKEGWSVTILAAVGLFGASITYPNAYLYAGELFPTVVRNSGVGFCSLTGRIGSIVAPFVVQTGDIAAWLPPFIFGLFSAAAVVSIFLLPETKGHPIPDTIEQGEEFGKKKKPQA